MQWGKPWTGAEAPRHRTAIQDTINASLPQTFTDFNTAELIELDPMRIYSPNINLRAPPALNAFTDKHYPKKYLRIGRLKENGLPTAAFQRRREWLKDMNSGTMHRSMNSVRKHWCGDLRSNVEPGPSKEKTCQLDKRKCTVQNVYKIDT